MNVAQASAQELGNLLPDDKGKNPSGGPARVKVPKRITGAEQPVVVKKLS